MRNCMLALTFMFFAVPAMAETITVKTPNERFHVIDVIRRTNSTVYTVLDTQTGEVSYRHLPLPRRRIAVSTRTWDPYAGRYREIIGYDHRSMPVCRDSDHSRVVYWITDRTTDASNGAASGGATATDTTTAE